MKPGQEYILTVQSLENVKADKDYGPRTLRISADSSDRPAQTETELKSAVLSEIRKRPMLTEFESYEPTGTSNPAPESRDFDSHHHNQSGHSENFTISRQTEIESHNDGETARFSLRTTAKQDASVLDKTLFRLDYIPNLFNLYFDPDSVSNPDYLAQAMECLSGVMPALVEVFGFPKSANGDQPINLLVAPFSDSRVVGRFNRLDRYTKNDGKDLPGVNKGRPILYFSPDLLNAPDRDGPSRICATSAHEFQHLMNYEYKVLRPIPENERYDLASVIKYRREREFLGLDEGIAHLVEELSGGDQRVYGRLLDFLNTQGEGSFSLELNYSAQDGNSRARGANLALVYYALNHVGGNLNWPDEDTQKFLREVVTSPEIGYVNLANVLKTTPEKLFADFWAKLDESLFSFEATQDLFPLAQITDGITRGITVLDRDETIATWQRVGAASFHPLAADLPLLARAQAARLLPQSFVRYRWIAPASKPVRPQNKIVFEGDAGPYLVVWSRVR